MQYVKYISETQIQYPPKNFVKEDGTTILNFDKDVETMKENGYKELVYAEREQGKSYKITYEEIETQIIEHIQEIIPDPTELLKTAKEQKIAENDEKRDKALFGGVEYQNVLFDSDDSQKINLLATYNRMSDTDTIVWFGMDNIPLECTKLDLFNIGDLITKLHTFCWQNNYEIKLKINNAENLEELEKIEINYNY